MLVKNPFNVYVRKVKVIFSLDVNKILDHPTYDLLTCQHTKTPELFSVSSGDEFDLEFNWNEVFNPVL